MAISGTGNDWFGNYLFIFGNSFYNEGNSVERTVENP